MSYIKHLYKKIRGWYKQRKHQPKLQVPYKLRAVIDTDRYLQDLLIRPEGCSNKTYSRRRSRYNKLKRLYVRQQGKCGLTGLPLCNVFGPGIDVDHIVPKSRGGNRSIDNLQLTYSVANNIKSNKLQSELVSEDYKKMRLAVESKYSSIARL